MAIKGSCLCGGIRFEIDAARSLTFCHCSNCRKLSGAAFASYVHVDADKFRFIAGEELIPRLGNADSLPTKCVIARSSCDEAIQGGPRHSPVALDCHAAKRRLAMTRLNEFSSVRLGITGDALTDGGTRDR